MADWDWTHDAVVAGETITVKVNVSPCRPVTVVLTIDGHEVDRGTIATPPDSVDLSVPDGTQGQAYVLTVSCNGKSESRNGTVG
jgi:hypothetical protein